MKIVTTKRENGTRSVRIEFDRESKVEQSHRDEVNINSILLRYHATGTVPQVGPGTYGDFTGAVDYHESLNRLAAAEKDFFSLPSNVRKKFENDPGRLLDWIDDPENAEEGRRIGLLPSLVVDPLLKQEVPEKKAEEASSKPVEASSNEVKPEAAEAAA